MSYGCGSLVLQWLSKFTWEDEEFGLDSKTPLFQYILPQKPGHKINYGFNTLLCIKIKKKVQDTMNYTESNVIKGWLL